LELEAISEESEDDFLGSDIYGYSPIFPLLILLAGFFIQLVYLLLELLHLNHSVGDLSIPEDRLLEHLGLPLHDFNHEVVLLIPLSLFLVPEPFDPIVP